MITKHNVCLFIKDEEHLEEMREFLESKGEVISEYGSFRLSSIKYNYLKFFDGWFLANISTDVLVTTEQFKKLWE